MDIPTSSALRLALTLPRPEQFRVSLPSRPDPAYLSVWRAFHLSVEMNRAGSEIERNIQFEAKASRISLGQANARNLRQQVPQRHRVTE